MTGAGLGGVLAAPLHAVVELVGSGAVAGLTSGVRADAGRLTGAADAARRGDVGLADWRGGAGEQARTAVTTLRTDAASGAGRATALADRLDDAAALVLRAKSDLHGVVGRFETSLAALGPALATPAGPAAVLALTRRHLTEAVGVVTALRRDLDALAGGLPQPREPGAKPGTGRGQAGATGTGVDVVLPNGKTVRAPNEKAAAAVRAALTQQGVPYQWGGTTPGVGLDCSGFTQYAYRQAGVELPRLADQQAVGRPVSAGEVQAGDLLVWDGHVAMALGDGTLIEAGDPVQIGGVRETNLGQRFHGYYRPTG